MAIRTRFRTISAAAVFASAAANPAFAAETTISVSGDSVYSECGAGKSATYATELSGSLIGCLAAFVQSTSCHERNGFASSIELGREEFEGTLDGKPIRFGTVYTFEAVWPAGSCPTPAPESEIAGGCDHYVSGEGVSGLIKFYDVIPTVGKGATNFLYEGTLMVTDKGSAAIEQLVKPSLVFAGGAATAVQKPRTMAC